MKGRDVLFSKSSDEWETQQWLFDKLNKEFHFDCDAAANEYNSKCGEDWLQNALEDDWMKFGYKKFYLNPPYGKIAAFMKKAYEESLKGAVVVCLIPVRSDTRYWHNYVMMAHEIRLIMGRLKFNNRTLPPWKSDGSHKLSSATFPSCVVIFDHSKYDKNNDPIFTTIKQPI